MKRHMEGFILSKLTLASVKFGELVVRSMFADEFKTGSSDGLELNSYFEKKVVFLGVFDAFLHTHFLIAK